MIGREERLALVGGELAPLPARTLPPFLRHSGATAAGERTPPLFLAVFLDFQVFYVVTVDSRRTTGHHNVSVAVRGFLIVIEGLECVRLMYKDGRREAQQRLGKKSYFLWGGGAGEARRERRIN